MDKTENMSFEEALIKLEECADKLKDSSTGLDESMKIYDNSIMYYKRCKELLSNARQKIELYDPEKNERTEFDGYK